MGVVQKKMSVKKLKLHHEIIFTLFAIKPSGEYFSHAASSDDDARREEKALR